MKTNHIITKIVAILAILAVSAVAQDKKIVSVEESALATITATVQAIDVAKREVSLKGPRGNTVTFVVDKRVKRLDEVKVGDEVTANYYTSLALELRAPTKDEEQNPVQMVEGTARAPKGTEPAAGTLHVIKAVAKVKDIDLTTRSLTLQGQGPIGATLTIRDADVEKLKQLHIGDTVMVTYTEGLAVSLEKAKRE
jgi:hypothetical protein